MGRLQRYQCVHGDYVKKTVRCDPFTTGGGGDCEGTIGLLIMFFHGYRLLLER